MTKKELREKYKQKRSLLNEKQIEELSIDIANQCLKLPIWHVAFYHIFLPIKRLKEVNTEYILNILYGKDKRIVVSRSDFQNFTMKHYLLDEQVIIRNNEMGIPEPQNGIEILSQAIEVVFVPLLAYDSHGNRVGYGKGFYDRFLSQCKKEVISVGLSFFSPETQIQEASEYDYRLDYVVHPNGIISFKENK